jgi:methyltransferase
VVKSDRPLVVAVAAVAGQRLAELAWSRRNERRLRERGAVEHGAEHYPWMVAVHTAWLLGTAIEGWRSGRLHRVALGGFLAVQPLRLWVIATLGDRWTTRVYEVDEPPIRRGPYRFVDHPNYLVVATEIAALPVAFGAWRTAVAGSLANATVLSRRLAVERGVLRAMSARRDPAPNG